jgi:hypothetical protein
MPRSLLPNEDRLLSITDKIKALTTELTAITAEQRVALRDALLADNRDGWLKNEIKRLRASSSQIEAFINDFTPARIERVQITLGRSDSIAKYFAFIFIHRPRYPLGTLKSEFFGSGIYAIYYKGRGEPAYRKLSGTETPIYIGKADPATPYAESTLEQGLSLCSRLKEHAKNIGKTSLNPEDFEYRYASIQSGMQAAVEEFLIRLFRPIWNKEDAICHGIGKHGDSYTTRGNKRSPWDTMHPGRAWAAATLEDQASREKVVERIEAHLAAHPPYKSLEALLEALIKL